jgi:hypothetical protein
MENQMSSDIASTVAPDSGGPVEQELYDIAMECDVSIERWDGESLEDFAERLVGEITDKIIELDGYINDIRDLDLDEDQEARQ